MARATRPRSADPAKCRRERPRSCGSGSRKARPIKSINTTLISAELCLRLQIATSKPKPYLEVANCDLKAVYFYARTAAVRTRQLALPVESRILILRHQRVILDSDLAELYGVPVKQLNQQIKRNRERFPTDFMFQLTAKEDQILRSQIVTSKKGTADAATHPTPSPNTAPSWPQPCSTPSGPSR